MEQKLIPECVEHQTYPHTAASWTRSRRKTYGEMSTKTPHVFIPCTSVHFVGVILLQVTTPTGKERVTAPYHVLTRTSALQRLKDTSVIVFSSSLQRKHLEYFVNPSPQRFSSLIEPRLSEALFSSTGQLKRSQGLIKWFSLYWRSAATFMYV